MGVFLWSSSVLLLLLAPSASPAGGADGGLCECWAPGAGTSFLLTEAQAEGAALRPDWTRAPSRPAPGLAFLVLRVRCPGRRAFWLARDRCSVEVSEAASRAFYVPSGRSLVGYRRVREDLEGGVALRVNASHPLAIRVRCDAVAHVVLAPSCRVSYGGKSGRAGQVEAMTREQVVQRLLGDHREVLKEGRGEETRVQCGRRVFYLLPKVPAGPGA